MRLRLILPFVLTALANAQSLDPKLLAALPNDAGFFLGMNLNAYRQSELRNLYPIAFGGVAGADPAWLDEVRQLILVQASPDGPLHLAIAIGASRPPSVPEGSDRDAAETCGSVAPAIFACGDPVAVAEVAARYGGEASAGKSDLAANLKTLSDSYDNWFLALNPLQLPTDFPGPRKYWDKVAVSVKRVSGGIRLGHEDRFEINVEVDNPATAAALVQLLPWVAAFVEKDDLQFGAIADLAGNLTASARGSVASASFTLDEGSLRERLHRRGGVPASSSDPSTVPSAFRR